MQKSSIISRIASSAPLCAGLLFWACVYSTKSSCAGELDSSTSPSLFPVFSLDSTYESEKRSESRFYDQTTPLAMLFVGLINLYQRVFSAQEGSATCQFRPSCSHYGATAIKKFGVVQGTLMTGDRLLRCNQWAQGKYPLWRDNYHLHDPIEEHDLWAYDSIDIAQ